VLPLGRSEGAGFTYDTPLLLLYRMLILLCKLDPNQSLQDIPQPQKQSPPKPLCYYEGKYSVPKRAMAEAYCSRHYALQQVGEHFGVSYATVSQAVRVLECSVNCKA